MVSMLAADLIVDCKDIIGEGPVWDSRECRMLWLDNAIGRLHFLRPRRENEWTEEPRRELARHTGAIVPRRSGGFILLAGQQISELGATGEPTPVVSLADAADGLTINDAKCDPQGRLWFGTMPNDFAPGKCALYRLGADHRLTNVLGGIGLSNGMDWSPDGSIFYYVDSLTHAVQAFDFDGATGEISGPRIVVAFPFGQGCPDGMCVDSEGCLWVALFGLGEVHRFSPDGELLMAVATRVPNVTSCAFGGDNLSTLFVTTASLDLPDPLLPLLGFDRAQADAASSAPAAGGLFACRPGAVGQPIIAFEG